MTRHGKNILLINGPELDTLGTREPEIYGTNSLEEIESAVRKKASKAGYDIVSLQSDNENKISTFIREQGLTADGIIINPAILTHHSIEVCEALASVDCVKIEVHLSNLYARENFRHESITGGSCDGVIMGFGMDGYLLAMDEMLQLLKVPSNK